VVAAPDTGMTDLVGYSRSVEDALGVPPLIRVNGKAPLDPAWTTGPRRDPSTWRRKLEGHTGNVGMLTGCGLVGIDVDLHHDGAADALDELRDRGLPILTVTSITGGGGAHYLYRTPADVEIPSRPLPGLVGIDVKGHGGMLVIPPSVHPNGQPYEWEYGWSAFDHVLLDLPVPMLDLVGAGMQEREARELDERDHQAVELLLQHFDGHSPEVRKRSIMVTRPGKERGTSAEVGYLGPGVTMVWSSNWPGLPAGMHALWQLRKLAGVPPREWSIPRRLEPAVDPELPDGYRLWREGDDLRPVPVLASAARHGLVGHYLDLLDGQTEAGLAAVGALVLVHLGTLIGRRAVVCIGPHRQHANLYTLVIGESSTGAKGSAEHAAERLTEHVAPGFFVRHAMGGFGSGEALVEAVRDMKTDEDPNEKRRVINESEFSAVLRVARRESSILSEIIRQGFDYKPIRHRTKTHGTITSTGHHLAIVGSITPAELFACSSALDVENGWLNRFLFVHSEMQRVLPFGGDVDDAELRSIAAHVGDALDALYQRASAAFLAPIEYPIIEGSPTGDVWEPWYRQVRTGSGAGRVAALTKRQHVQAARLALVFAVLDRAVAITPAHLQAAMAWTDYSVAGVERYFGHGPGGQAGKLLDAIRTAMPDGLSVAEQHAVFGRHLKGVDLERLRAQLEGDRLIVTAVQPTDGRPRETCFAITPLRTNEVSE
jgi:hypothetical protein